MPRKPVDQRDPRLVASGKVAAAIRWGPKRRLKIGDLTPEQREIVLALIEAHRTANRIAASLVPQSDAGVGTTERADPTARRARRRPVGPIASPGTEP